MRPLLAGSVTQFADGARITLHGSVPWSLPAIILVWCAYYLTGLKNRAVGAEDLLLIGGAGSFFGFLVHVYGSTSRGAIAELVQATASEIEGG